MTNRCTECNEKLLGRACYDWAYELTPFQIPPDSNPTMDVLMSPSIDKTVYFCSLRCCALYCAPILRKAIEDPNILERLSNG